MKVETTKIEGLLILHPSVFGDDRGWFMESFNQQRFAQALEDLNLPVPTFVQDNHSLSQKGVLRGLHYQNAPYGQGKLVRVVQGRVWDVAVDIRPDSKTYGEWIGVELSAENKTMFWIPEGFAHGFISLEDNTQFLYKTTNYYNKESEGAIIWNDPTLAIDWPLAEVDEVLVSDKDQAASLFTK
ncbi:MULTISPECIES: dTDP-4-dehydrorhamnose 3,5-epimerase [Acinetobacter]|jgi:dTDP-4-dehydrorhamnose 3,5-epimerase|uniref:dTDP-4-dehydrorhamnose 3,5-epimerase n=1 Tax=Acinetobacter pittii TaxID=48296 RepID=A0A1C2WYM3_ACIPI|nr:MULTISPECIES: dTDP-4-dehydrorhamnose 3,5-epimerase [Acinetobacter]AMO42203.1 dTDP-4-dehydrorhamnose 3,5-epimerase [Acinetobacter sp. DUT-2]QNB03909.1 dTDP-4-dehydrorhamnose 3,5-epimerase [Acinetobacter baumannii]ENW09576.1 dTDP-4-dehydrorhamnose 3,5-epimerase [Acinetobacter pittii ANC 3678]EXA89027.1 dTDP-4-dehydrorhamnose 3,5-epimerase [Acinetobacter sp. 1289694]EXB77593.1 dTDP-4-dehydrorhamnose 3,5-epimerase [Acinetobacter sp. 1475718]